ncbi:uncharacterized protein WCC33_011789 [Rhinophrynus dorsalis]
MGTGVCSRRQKSLLHTGFCLLALLALGSGIFLYNYILQKAKSSEALAVKTRQQQDALSAQLQVVYEHRSRLERSLQKERGEHKKTKEDFLVYKLEAQEALNKEKQDSMNRYGALSSQHKILKNQHDDLKKQLSDLQVEYSNLKLEHRKALENHSQRIGQLQRDKESEIVGLQDNIFKLREENKLLRKAHHDVHTQLLSAQAQMEEFRQLKDALKKMPSFKDSGTETENRQLVSNKKVSKVIEAQLPQSSQGNDRSVLDPHVPVAEAVNMKRFSHSLVPPAVQNSASLGNQALSEFINPPGPASQNGSVNHVMRFTRTVNSLQNSKEWKMAGVSVYVWFCDYQWKTDGVSVDVWFCDYQWKTDGVSVDVWFCDYQEKTDRVSAVDVWFCVYQEKMDGVSVDVWFCDYQEKTDGVSVDVWFCDYQWKMDGVSVDVWFCDYQEKTDGVSVDVWFCDYQWKTDGVSVHAWFCDYQEKTDGVSVDVWFCDYQEKTDGVSVDVWFCDYQWKTDGVSMDVWFCDYQEKTDGVSVDAWFCDYQEKTDGVSVDAWFCDYQEKTNGVSVDVWFCDYQEKTDGVSVDVWFCDYQEKTDGVSVDVWFCDYQEKTDGVSVDVWFCDYQWKTDGGSVDVWFCDYQWKTDGGSVDVWFYAGMIDREENLQSQNGHVAQELLIPNDAADPAKDPNNQGEDEFEEAEIDRPDFEEKVGVAKPPIQQIAAKKIEGAELAETSREEREDHYQDDQEQDIEERGGDPDNADDIDLEDNPKELLIHGV